MTRIRDDLNKPARVHGDALPWEPSPLPGVVRRRLERVGDEVARATSFVRYARGASFSAHTHGGGEEFLVLDGVFTDEHGDYPAGTYVRNPVGSRHTPSTREGCDIFVKLWWMHPEEQTRVVIDLHQTSGWRETSWGRRRALFEGLHEAVTAADLNAGQALLLDAHDGGHEVLIIQGAVRIDGEAFTARAWLRQPPGEALRLDADEDTRMLIKTGHLAAPPALPEAV